jgi:hypothetical protein
MLNKSIMITVIMSLLAWVGLLWLPALAAGHRTIESLAATTYRLKAEARMGPDRIYLAENKQGAEEENTTGANQEGQAAEKPATDNTNPAGKEKAKTKTLQTYVPTEKVKADQIIVNKDWRFVIDNN